MIESPHKLEVAGCRVFLVGETSLLRLAALVILQSLTYTQYLGHKRLVGEFQLVANEDFFHMLNDSLIKEILSSLISKLQSLLDF